MLFHVDMIYLAKPAKRDVEKSFASRWDENRNQIEHRTGFLQFYVKTKKYADVLPVLTQNKSILHMACTPGGGGGTLIFSHIRRLGPFFWVKNS